MQGAEHVGELLDRRADLRGLLPLADVVHEAVRWAA